MFLKKIHLCFHQHNQYRLYKDFHVQFYQLHYRVEIFCIFFQKILLFVDIFHIVFVFVINIYDHLM